MEIRAEDKYAFGRELSKWAAHGGQSANAFIAGAEWVTEKILSRLGLPSDKNAKG